MNQETRKCQNCKQDFAVEPEDFDFYKKMDVPPPTWCPECRILRKILWRTDIGFHRRPDSRTGEMIFSQYPETAPIKVWDYNYWISDQWDPLEYGKEYDWNKPFFEQYNELIKAMPWPSLSVINPVNSPYCNNGTDVKSCYLVFGSTRAEDSYCSFGLLYSKNIFNCDYIRDSELNHEGVFNRKCYRAFYSNHCKDSYDIYFSKDCVNVSNCFGCIGLKSKSYCIFNRQVSKEEYADFMKNAELGSYAAVQEWIRKSQEEWIKFPRKAMWGSNNVGVSGEYINNSKNVKNSWGIDNGENLRYCQFLESVSVKDCYDYFRFSHNAELVYEAIGTGGGLSNVKFSLHCFPNCRSLSYCVNCGSSDNLFGCFGLKKKQYCILNKQYTKEEYESLVPKIIQHMNDMPYISKIRNSKSPACAEASAGREIQNIEYKYGEFFPPEFSPLAFNESIALELFPMSETEAVSNGYRWGDVAEKGYKSTIPAENLPDDIKDVNDSVLNEIIECGHKGKCLQPCATVFRIVPRELEFYRQYSIPLPRICFPCRHYERLKLRNSFRLTERICDCAGSTGSISSLQASSLQTGEKSENGVYQNQVKHSHGMEKCSNEFETSYAADRQEIVYCEECYNAEVA